MVNPSNWPITELVRATLSRDSYDKRRRRGLLQGLAQLCSSRNRVPIQWTKKLAQSGLVRSESTSFRNLNCSLFDGYSIDLCT
ncbi:hypothetical protein Y032_0009g519 [Ancylostoma ceylanicum]|uniref:Uncharacterized protein n=1 Tax=Ancylostoma ceylanicum TaxID=53326 RepID=A0A016VHN2_9BILA|nr:hypothetical protein Y032_0009g519 [Ancylostoma ceylanicum]